MSTTLLTTILLLCVLIFVEGCSWKKRKSKRTTLHNYPILSAKDCPVDFRSYNRGEVEKRAKELNMRPVDYLHAVNSKRWQPIKKTKGVK